MKSLQVRDRKPDHKPAANQNSEHDVAVRLSSGDTEHIDGIILAGSVAIRAKDLHAIVREREPTVIFVKLLASCLPSPAQRVLPRRRVRLRHGLTRSSVSLSPASAG